MVSGSHAGGGSWRTPLGAFVLAILLLAVAAPVAAARNAYVVNANSASVSVFDTASNEVVGGPIGVGTGPGGIAITPDGGRAYVANHVSSTVSAIDTATNEVVGLPISVGLDPRGVAISPDGRHVYVASEGSESVSVIDTATDEVVGGPIPIGDEGLGIAITPDGARAYVALWGGGVSVIDTSSNEVVGSPIAVGPQAIAVAITPDGKTAYVTSRGSESVAAIDTATGTVIRTITVGANPMGIGITPDGSRAYVASEGPDTVSVIDTASNEVVGGPIAGVGSNPRGVAITPDGKRAYVTSQVPGIVSVIDTATNEVVGGPIAVGEEPLGIAIVPDQPPVAALAPIGATIAGQPLGLDASASHDPDGQVLRYDWNFGDGTTALDAGPKPAHTYNAPGAYSVTVTETDSEGCSTGLVFTGLTASCNGSAVARATGTVRVGKRPPSSEFQIGRLHRDRRHGTVRVTIQVPGPGELSLGGKAVRTVTRTVDGPETVTLTVRPKRAKMRVLKHRGHLRVRVEVTFSPDGGVPASAGRRLTLVRTSSGPPRRY